MNHEVQDEFRRTLRVELARASMSQRALANRLGVNDTTLSGWLTGAHQGPEDLVPRIEKALNLQPGALGQELPKP